MQELNTITKLIEKELKKYFSQTEALEEIKRIFPDITYFPPTRGWAASPDFLLKLIELILVESPSYVVEFGSGVSSVIIAATMKKFNDSNGKLESYDHEKVYCDQTNSILKINGLSDKLHVEFSPLVEYVLEDEEWLWYDKFQINKIKSDIDIIVVDGPPGRLQERSRYLALPLLYDKLSKKSIIVLDDSNRNNEKQVIESWIEFLNIKKSEYSVQDLNYFDKGLTIIRIKK